MENIKQILVDIDIKLEKEGIQNTLKKTENFMGQDPIKYLEDCNQNNEVYKYRVKHVLCAMSYVTLDNWTPDYMKTTGPEIFEPLLKILNF